MRGCLRNSSFVYSPNGRGGAVGWFKGFDLFGRRWGVDVSTVFVGKERYLDRWILYVNGYTLRLHRFWRGDDDRASHSHPWAWFITFPLTSYFEKVFSHGQYLDQRVVRRFRLHFRNQEFEHIVVEPFSVPGWTIVATGPKVDTWGFWPRPGQFVRWNEYD